MNTIHVQQNWPYKNVLRALNIIHYLNKIVNICRSITSRSLNVLQSLLIWLIPKDFSPVKDSCNYRGEHGEGQQLDLALVIAVHLEKPCTFIPAQVLRSEIGEDDVMKVPGKCEERASFSHRSNVRW